MISQNAFNIHRLPRTALKSSTPLKGMRQERPDMQLLQSRFQAPEITESGTEHHSRQLYRRVRCHQVPVTSYWQSLMAPLTNSPPAGLVSCVTQELENHQPHHLHQPTFWFHAVQGQMRSHLTPPACPQPGLLPQQPIKPTSVSTTTNLTPTVVTKTTGKLMPWS